MNLCVDAFMCAQNTKRLMDALALKTQALTDAEQRFAQLEAVMQRLVQGAH